MLAQHEMNAGVVPNDVEEDFRFSHGVQLVSKDEATDTRPYNFILSDTELLPLFKAMLTPHQQRWNLLVVKG